MNRFLTFLAVLLILTAAVISTGELQKQRKQARPPKPKSVLVSVLKCENGEKDGTATVAGDGTYFVVGLDMVDQNPRGIKITAWSTNITVVGIHTDLGIAVLKRGAQSDGIPNYKIQNPKVGATVTAGGTPKEYYGIKEFKVRISGVSTDANGIRHINFRGNIDPSMVGGMIYYETPGHIGFITKVGQNGEPSVAVSARQVVDFVKVVQTNVEKNLKSPTTLGKIGFARRDTEVFSEPNVDSKVLYNLSEREFVVVNDQKNEKFWGILLVNGSTGYVIRDAVLLGDYDFTQALGRTGVLVRGKTPMTLALKDYVSQMNAGMR